VLPPPSTKEFFDRVLALEGECRQELEQSVQSLSEIQLLLAKTNSEVEKLANRELQMSNRVRDMEMHLDNYSREDIRDLYNTSHEIQLRLFMMRSQAEQLQNRQQHIKDYQQKLRLLIDLLSLQATPAEEPTAAGRGTTSMLDGKTKVLGGVGALSLVEAQEDERLRVSREIGDGPTQSLTNLMLKAEICGRLLDRDPAEARSELAGLKEMINASLQETRRISFDLRPLMIGEIGLVGTLRKYFAELQRLQGIACDVSGPDTLPLNDVMQIALFRFVQAGLAALLTDGGADAVSARIGFDSGLATVDLDGVNVDSDREAIAAALQEPHLAHRLTYFGATLEWEPRPNRGHAIEIAVPVPPEAMLLR
jgi:two-component system sensor histidine kinase DegS